MSAAPKLAPEAEALAKYVQRKFDSGKDVHKSRCDRWARWYRLYRSRQEFKRVYGETSPRDVDSVLNDARGIFGADLFIPYVFSVIETTLPRMLSQNPTMNLTPAPIYPGAVPNLDLDLLEQHADTLKLAFNRYQTYMQYPLVMQDIAKSGLIFGFGLGKSYWLDNVKRSQTRIVQSASGSGYVQGKYDKIVYSGPRVECVDIFEAITDPTAWDMDTMGWIVHRTWRDGDYLRKMLDTGAWELPEGVELDDLLSSGGSTGREEGWAQRMEAQGIENPEKRRRGQELHEVWEFADGEDVITLWDRCVPVQAGNNPYWHMELNWSIYRPTRVPHELLGIGEPEAIEDLQEEMNTLRSQRRDNASLVLQRPFAYFDGLGDPGDWEFGPGAMWPVDGDPSSLIFPIPLQDIPGSSFNEEDRLQADIERVSGINDMEAGAGASGAQQTATGAQLVHAAANVRIQNKTMLLATETCTPQAQQTLALLQQKITDEHYFAGPPRPGERSPWSWYVMGPEVLLDDWLVEADGGSFAPENIQQERADALSLQPLFADPLVDPMWVREQYLEKLGYKDAKRHLIPPEPQIPLHAIEMVKAQLAGELQQAGVDPQAFAQHFDMLVAAASQPEQGGPGGPGQPQLPAGAPDQGQQLAA